MRISNRFALALFAALLATLAALPLAFSQQPADDVEALADEVDPAEAKRLAKEARISEYLRKKEEQRLLRDMNREAAEALEVEQRQLAEQSAPAKKPDGKKNGHGAGAAAAAVPRSAALPRDLARAQAAVRQTELARDPTVQKVMNMIDAQEASAMELAAFGNFISEASLHPAALVYYRVALRLVEDDEVLWVNYGTLHRKLGDLSAAESAYAKALGINPYYALAHYNLGAIYEERNKYTKAIESYMIALRLDPNLGDPAYNPQAASNEKLNTVRLMLYDELIGTAGLPLVDVSGERDDSTP